jgi:hypothetical protein
MKYNGKYFLRFIGIFLIVFLSQIPGCLVVLLDDAGQINYFEYEMLIRASQETFAFPLLRIFKESINSEGGLILVYLMNLLLISSIILLFTVLWRNVRRVWQDKK